MARLCSASERPRVSLVPRGATPGTHSQVPALEVHVHLPPNLFRQLIKWGAPAAAAGRGDERGEVEPALHGIVAGTLGDQ